MGSSKLGSRAQWLVGSRTQQIRFENPMEKMALFWTKAWWAREQSATKIVGREPILREGADNGDGEGAWRERVDGGFGQEKEVEEGSKEKSNGDNDEDDAGRL
ncbi:hypothetical protein SLEP1_g33461 [Rubroshorea leprosula]|uniref:Uncharacterized protein n=1 Tax=Rubroshorea leprosula TaxID=152421 RepID=A0AAV5KGU5_9ROSI|nr:hypothetical protein SLEP1_g33461 [Rubroshorea leprosula]